MISVIRKDLLCPKIYYALLIYGPSYEHVVDQEVIVDLDCYHLLSFQSLHARGLQVDDFTTSHSVSAAEQAALVYEWATEQDVTSEDLRYEPC